MRRPEHWMDLWIISIAALRCICLDKCRDSGRSSQCRYFQVHIAYQLYHIDQLNQKESFIGTEMTHRFQTARTDVRFLLLQCLLPWLENMELLASSVPATISPLSYIMYYPDSGMKGRRDGSGSTEATEMILNNLFYITAKVSLH